MSDTPEGSREDAPVGKPLMLPADAPVLLIAVVLSMSMFLAVTLWVISLTGDGGAALAPVLAFGYIFASIVGAYVITGLLKLLAKLLGRLTGN